MKKRVLSCMLAAVLACGAAGSAAAEAATPTPFVRPTPVRFDYRLPSVKLNEENFETYFSVETRKEYSRGQHLRIPFEISPREPYEWYDGSSLRIAVRLKVSVFLTEDAEEPLFEKTYTELLHRDKGFRASGVIEVLVRPDREDVWYTCTVQGCNGLVGLDGWEQPTPAPEE